jgi:hypothetical protein
LTAPTFATQSGRFVLEDSVGELWLVMGPNDPRAFAFGYRPLEGALLFQSEGEDRLYRPVPRARQHLSEDEREQACQAATKLSVRNTG